MFSLVKSRWIRYPLVANTPLKIKFPSKWLTGDAMLRLILGRTFNNVRSRCACTHGCSPRDTDERSSWQLWEIFYFFYTGADLWMAQIPSGRNIRFSGRQLVLLSEVARSIASPSYEHRRMRRKDENMFRSDTGFVWKLRLRVLLYVFIFRFSKGEFSARHTQKLLSYWIMVTSINFTELSFK